MTTEVESEKNQSVEFFSPTDMENAFDDFVTEISKEIKNGFDSKQFGEFLEASASLGNDYSTRNKVLIQMQRPDVVGPFNGYKQWIENFGRIPEKGSQAVKVLAPCFVKKCAESNEKVSECDECDDECENVNKVVVNYRYVNVFAYSQTTELDDSDERKPENTKDISNAMKLNVETDVSRDVIEEYYNNLITSYESKGYAVKKVTDPKEWNSYTLKGYIENDSKTIKTRALSIEDDKEERDIENQFRTFVHETAHYYLGHTDENENYSKKIKELEAEAVTYLVLKRLGIDADSGVYISTKMIDVILDSNRKVDEYVKESIENILPVAEQILEDILTE